MLEVMRRARRNPRSMAKGASWIYAQHLLRTRTEFIIFPSGEVSRLNALVEAANAGAIPEAVAVQDIEKMQFALGRLEMHGHVGALYFQNVDQPDQPFQLTQGTKRFHEALAARFQGTTDVLSFVAQLESFVKEEVWDGEVKLPDPGELPDLHRTVNEVPVDFRGHDNNSLRDDVRDGEGHIVRRNGGKMISTLRELGERQKARRNQILRMIRDVNAQLGSLGGQR